MFDDLIWLENNPLAFQSVEILEDSLGALEGLRATHGFEEVVLISFCYGMLKPCYAWC